MKTHYLVGRLLLAATLSLTSVATTASMVRAGEPILLAQQVNSTIDEAAVREVLEEFFIESENLSVDSAVVQYTAPFVLGDFTVLALGSEHRIITESREEMRALLDKSYENLTGVRHLRRVVDIDIAPDGQRALAEDDSIIELTYADGSKHLAESLTLTRFAMVNGQMVITSIVSESIMDIRPELLNLQEDEQVEPGQ